MKQIGRKITNFLTKNLWIIFFTNIKSIIETIVWLCSLISDLYELLFKNTQNMIKDFPLEFNDYMLFIVTLILYFILRAFYKSKKKIETIMIELNNSNVNWNNQLSYVSSEITNNLNDLSRIINLRIAYVGFRTEYKDLPNDLYIKKLSDKGFSKEDLDDIGLNVEFLNQNKDKLLPRKVMQKYQDFKKELEIYKNEYNRIIGEIPE